LTLLWIIPYLIGGFSAPLIFKLAPTKQIGGHIAGALFIFAGIWSLYLARKFNFSPLTKVIFAGVLLLQIIFWSWRYFNATELKSSVLLGLSGSNWHSILTTLYLLVAAKLAFNLLAIRR
jgi:hypothetical protein